MTATLKGGHVLAAMLAFFGVVIAINVGFVVVALRSFPGEDERRSYLQGLHYNDTLAERRVQQSAGWRAGAELRPSAGGAELLVVMRARDGVPLNGLSVSGALERRTSAQLDRALAFTPRGAGLYAARLDGLQPGEWRLRARANNSAGDALDFESELIWRSP